MIILAVDLGKARTGLAICDKTMFLSSPLTVIEERNRERLAEKVIAEAIDKKAETIVVGLPKNMDGTEGESALGAKSFAQMLKECCDIPIVLWDERCTTMIAHRYMNDTNTRGKKRKQTVDGIAAAVILQNYLDYLKNESDRLQ